ncbi:MAG: hypothetical protein ACI85K_001171, partial [Hyphomicrobiaceae bacterium]
TDSGHGGLRGSEGANKVATPTANARAEISRSWLAPVLSPARNPRDLLPSGPKGSSQSRQCTRWPEQTGAIRAYPSHPPQTDTHTPSSALVRRDAQGDTASDTQQPSPERNTGPNPTHAPQPRRRLPTDSGEQRANILPNPSGAPTCASRAWGHASADNHLELASAGGVLPHRGEQLDEQPSSAAVLDGLDGLDGQCRPVADAELLRMHGSYQCRVLDVFVRRTSRRACTEPGMSARLTDGYRVTLP